jgi:hypothetical protein
MALWSTAEGRLGRSASLGLHRDVVAVALSTALNAWNSVRASGRVSAKSRETQIAGELCSGMWDILEGQTEPPLFRVEEEVGTRGPGARMPTGRVDIKIIGGFRYHDFLLIECKRVRGDRRTLAKKYVLEGVMRFVSGRYAPGHPLGVLFGFVISGTPPQAAALIEIELAAHPPVASTIAWHISSAWPLPSTAYSTTHTQALAYHHEIELLHILLLV